MPMSGTIRHVDVYGNLLEVLSRLEPGTTATDVGMQLRAEAIKYVEDSLPRDGAPGKWSSREDVRLPISEHDMHPPALEGMEAYSSDPYDGPYPPPPPGWGRWLRRRRRY